MSLLLTIDKTITYQSGYKYQLMRDFKIKIPLLESPLYSRIGDYIYINSKNILQIRKGYAWDGPSGPTFDTKNAMRASLVHDVIYQMIGVGAIRSRYRNIADKIFYDILREDGMSWWRAKLWYRSVRKFGGGHLEAKKLLTAP